MSKFINCLIFAMIIFSFLTKIILFNITKVVLIKKSYHTHKKATTKDLYDQYPQSIINALVVIYMIQIVIDWLMNVDFVRSRFFFSLTSSSLCVSTATLNKGKIKTINDNINIQCVYFYENFLSSTKNAQEWHSKRRRASFSI